jgi:hypothetical protein
VFRIEQFLLVTPYYPQVSTAALRQAVTPTVTQSHSQRALVPILSADAPFAELVRLSKHSIADELNVSRSRVWAGNSERGCRRRDRPPRTK